MALKPDDLLHPTPAGLYCPPADCHIDPVRPVDRALITHAHSDHARPGHGRVLATPETLGLMAVRMGANFAGAVQAVGYGESVSLNGVRFTFVPAGHVLGSAQIAVEWRGLTIVVSGDYKDVADPTCTPFEPVACEVFVTEATFGLPVFRHGDAAAEATKLIASARLFPERTHLVGAYSLGKAQRLMALMRAAGWDRPIYIHGAVEKVTRYYTGQGIALGEVLPVPPAGRGKAARALEGEIVICPPSALNDAWSRRFADPVTVFASGWMRVRARAKQRGVELPLVVSDHVDWDGLTRAIPATGASEVWVTHGAEDALVHWAMQRGLAARPVRLVGYGDEDEAPDASTAPAEAAP
jgi:putative mRNA 3-end processing factor